MKKIVVLFSGAGSNFRYILENLHKKEYEVVFALTNNHNAGGIDIAKEYSIPFEVVEHKAFNSREEYDAKVVERINLYNPDLTILAGFMRILTPIFTKQIKAINLHPSLLPRNKGLHAIEKSYKDSYDDGGVTVHYVSSELDGGEIIVQESISKKGLSFKEYDNKIRTIEKEALVTAIGMVLER